MRDASGGLSDNELTPEETLMLASIRKSSGRTCANCVWLEKRGPHMGCFPEGKYRKFLSSRERDLGCELFVARNAKRTYRGRAHD